MRSEHRGASFANVCSQLDGFQSLTADATLSSENSFFFFFLDQSRVSDEVLAWFTDTIAPEET